MPLAPPAAVAPPAAATRVSAASDAAAIPVGVGLRANRQLRAGHRLEDPPPVGDARRPGAAVDAQLPVGQAEVVLDRMVADVEAAPDLAVREPVGGQADDRQLAFGEGVHLNIGR